MRTLLVASALALAAGCATTPAAPEPAAPPPVPLGAAATAELKDQRGATVGTVELTQAPNGVVLKVKLAGAAPGERAFHVHDVGQCEPPFQTAGGHFNPKGHQHGIHNPAGKHGGDLPNLHVPASGELEVTLFTDGFTLDEGAGALFDADGASLMIHEGVDDYRSDPTGNAGGRYACGVLRKS